MKQLSFYLVKTELEFLSAEMIATEVHAADFNVAVCYGARTDQVNVVAFDRSFDVEGLKTSGSKYARFKSLERSLSEVVSGVESLGDFGNIYVHIPRLSAEERNYFIGYVKKSFVGHKVCVRIIPHGLGSVGLLKVGLKKRLRYLRRNVEPLRFLFPKLNFYSPRYDLVGFNDPIVDRVYLFSGMEAAAPAEKRYELPSIVDYVSRFSAGNPNERCAVVVGQSLLYHGLLTKEDERKVSEDIKDWLFTQGIQRVYYSKHPRSRGLLDFHRPEYEVLEQNGALEVLLCKLCPDVVVSSYSTVLVTAKSMFGDNVVAASFGLDKVMLHGRDELCSKLRDSGVQVIGDS